MEKILVAVFDTEKAAYEGLSALKSLHKDGEISLYASSVVAKDAAGNVAVRQAPEPGPIGTAVGLIGGALVGLVAGPAGALVGAWLGGSAGILYDLFNFGVDVDFMDQVSGSLTPGKVAVVADLDEVWLTPVETRLGALGATIFRQYPGDVLDEQLRRDAELAEAEMKAMDAEFEHADQAAKAALQARMTAQRVKIQALADRIDKAIKQEKAGADARLATLRSQLQTARADHRKRIEERIEEAQATHMARQEKLGEARMHAKSAIELTVEAVLV